MALIFSPNSRTSITAAVNETASFSLGVYVGVRNEHQALFLYTHYDLSLT